MGYVGYVHTDTAEATHSLPYKGPLTAASSGVCITVQKPTDDSGAQRGDSSMEMEMTPEGRSTGATSTPHIWYLPYSAALTAAAIGADSTDTDTPLPNFTSGVVGSLPRPEYVRELVLGSGGWISAVDTESRSVRCTQHSTAQGPVVRPLHVAAPSDLGPLHHRFGADSRQTPRRDQGRRCDAAAGRLRGCDRLVASTHTPPHTHTPTREELPPAAG